MSPQPSPGASYATRRHQTAPPQSDRPAELLLAEAFPAARITQAAGVGNQFGQVTPAGLLPDGTVYGVVKRPGTARLATAVTVDPRTGRQTVVAQGDAIAEPRFVAANKRWLLGVTEKPVIKPVGPACELAPAPCQPGPGPPARYWCHDRSTGRTVDVSAMLQKLGSRGGSSIVVPDISVIDTSIVLVADSADRPRYLAMDGCSAAPRPLGFPLLS